MRQILKVLLKWGAILLVSLAGIVLIQVRFFHLVISASETIILDYEEDSGRLPFNEPKIYELNGIDGPYVINQNIFRVTAHDEVICKPIDNQNEMWVSTIAGDTFRVRLNPEHPSPPSEYEMPGQLLVISDIEGNFLAFRSILRRQEVIDRHYRWNFGNGHLLLAGDFVDRGNDVIPVLWLIYKLEQEAAAAGGAVHFLLGNHEIMNIQGLFKYAQDRYRKIAEHIGKHPNRRNNYRELYSSRSELGRWLRSKNSVEKIGSYLFIHAGIGPDILQWNLSLDRINALVREHIDSNAFYNTFTNDTAHFLMGPNGPHWYRGLVQGTNDYNKLTEKELEPVLRHYGTESVVIGHTVVPDVSTDLNRRIIRIDVKHGKEAYSGNTRGLWIQKGEMLYVADDLGHKIPL